jgi:hypothetical protein
MEKILCSAIHYFFYPNCFAPIGHSVSNKADYQGVVLCGYRHPHIISQFKALTGKSTGPSNSTQGFLTSTNRFVGRQEAALIAYKAQQIPEQKKELYSEDIY